MLQPLTDLVAQLALAVPDPGEGAPPPGSESLLTVLSWIAWIAFAACVVGVLKAGGLLAMVGIGHRGSGDHGVALGAAIVGAIVCGSAAAIVTAVA